MHKYEGYNLDGDTSLIDKNKGFLYLAVVGSRNILNYTKEVLEDFFEHISSFRNIVIVSGGMYGVDIVSHNLAIKHDLGTIIFLPCGVHSYKNSSLYKTLKNNKNSKVLLVSKYTDNLKAKRYTYLERNREIVDISDVILIAQSGIKSGSIYSGNYSLRRGKITYCIPISLDNKQFLGNNLLISNGAKIYISHLELLVDLGIHFNKKLELQRLLKFLPSDLEGLSSKLTEYHPQDIEKTLLEAIIKGEIFLDNGDFYKK